MRSIEFDSNSIEPRHSIDIESMGDTFDSIQRIAHLLLGVFQLLAQFSDRSLLLLGCFLQISDCLLLVTDDLVLPLERCLQPLELNAVLAQQLQYLLERRPFLVAVVVTISILCVGRTIDFNRRHTRCRSCYISAAFVRFFRVFRGVLHFRISPPGSTVL